MLQDPPLDDNEPIENPLPDSVPAEKPKRKRRAKAQPPSFKKSEPGDYLAPGQPACPRCGEKMVTDGDYESRMGNPAMRYYRCKNFDDPQIKCTYREQHPKVTIQEYLKQHHSQNVEVRARQLRGRDRE